MRLSDLLFAARALRHRPGFVAAAVLLLALGTASTAAVFSVVKAVLLQPLAYHEPDRLVSVGPRAFISYRDVDYLSERLPGVESVAGQSPGWMMALVAAGGEPRKVTGARVTDNLFAVLGVPAVVGRTIQPGESAPGRTGVAVLSHRLWRTRFGGDPRTVGRTIQLDGDDHVVIGVMPRDFEVLDSETDLWAPLPRDPAAAAYRAGFAEAVARLAPSATPERTSARLRAILPDMRRELGHDRSWGRTFALVPLHRALVGDVRPTLLLLLGAVSLMLVLVAVNLGTLMLARAVERGRDLAVRRALGASPHRLAAELLAEQTLVAAAGALAGLVLASAMLPLLVSRIPPEMPRIAEVSMDATVVLAVFGAALAAVVAAALAPALLSSRLDPHILLRQARHTETPTRRRVLGGLVTTQVALSVLLGIGAGLVLRSLLALQHVDPGFRPESVLTLRLQTTSKYGSLEEGLPYFEQVVDRLRGLPGVTAVGAAGHLPMSGYSWVSNVRRPDHVLSPGEAAPQVGWRFIGWDYFRAMGIPLRGRAFSPQDTAAGAPVAIVNEAFARQYFGTPAAALGAEVLQRTGRSNEEVRVRIVGVAGDVRHQSLDAPAEPEIYRPLAQTFMFPMAFVLRAAVKPAQLAAAAREAAWSVDPNVPVAEIQPLSALLTGSIARPRLLALLLSTFAAGGLLLEVVGVYGVVAYRVRQRRKEFGIRLALGAPPSAVAGLVLRQGAWLALTGIAIGLAAAAALAHLAEGVLYGVDARDPLTFLLLPGVVVVATLAASAWPARRAASVQPLTVLRDE